MRNRRIGHQLLHVLLHQRHQTHIHNGDQRQRDHQPRIVVRGIGRDRQREAQETIGTELQHDRGQHGGTASGRLHVHIRQPGVHRPHRHLDREGCKEGKEQQGLLRQAKRQLVPGGEVEASCRLVVQEDQRDQHQQRAEQGVQKELERCVNLVRPAPDADDQVHRNQRGFKEHVEQHAVDGAEHADHQAAEDQESAHVLVHALGDHLPGRDHHDHVDERSQQHEPQRNSVNPQVVIDVETFDPRALFDELHRRRAQLEPVVQRQRDQKAGNSADQRNPAHNLGMLIATERQQHDTKKDRCPDGETQQTHFGVPSYLPGQTNQVISTNTPRIMAIA